MMERLGACAGARRTGHRRAGLLFAALLVACGSPRPPISLVPPEDLAGARDAAPDLVAEAERAEVRALQAQAEGDQASAEDHATLSRLFAEAAILEAERQGVEGQVLALQERLEQVALEAAALEDERTALDAEAGRQRAAEVARREARLAFEQAESDELRRVRRRRSENASMHRRAAATLVRRSRLLAAAAGALGANENAVLLVQDAALQAGQLGDPTEALREASASHRRALELLGEARRAHAVTPDAIQALLEMAGERGFSGEVSEGGVLLQGNLEQGRGLNDARVRALGDLLVAHPHGPVFLVGDRRGTAALLRGLERAGLASGRLQRQEGEGLHVLLPGYGEATRPSP